MEKYVIHYQTEPPTRTDQGEQNLPELSPVYSAEPENLLTHAEMHEILVEQFRLKCWGCNYVPPDKRYLHLDHIINAEISHQLLLSGHSSPVFFPI